jgi:hypothetical protein
MVNGSSNLKINNNEINYNVGNDEVDSYCFIMLKKYSNPIDGIVKRAMKCTQKTITNEIISSHRFLGESMSCSQRKPNQKKQGDE